MPYTTKTRGVGRHSDSRFNDSKPVPPLMPVVDCTDLIQAIYIQLFNDYIYAKKVVQSNRHGVIRSCPSGEALLKEATTSLVYLNSIFFDNDLAESVTFEILKCLNKGIFPAAFDKKSGRKNTQICKHKADRKTRKDKKND